jgi:ABC-type Fe3+-siderophore transport system permease subunit
MSGLIFLYCYFYNVSYKGGVTVHCCEIETWCVNWTRDIVLWRFVVFKVKEGGNGIWWMKLGIPTVQLVELLLLVCSLTINDYNRRMDDSISTCDRIYVQCSVHLWSRYRKQWILIFVQMTLYEGFTMTVYFLLKAHTIHSKVILNMAISDLLNSLVAILVMYSIVYEYSTVLLNRCMYCMYSLWAALWDTVYSVVSCMIVLLCM